MSVEVCDPRDFELLQQFSIASCPTRDEIGIAVANCSPIKVAILGGPAKLLQIQPFELHNEGFPNLELTGPVPGHEDREFVANLTPETGTGWFMVRAIKNP